jgi:hypothetical protein
MKITQFNQLFLFSLLIVMHTADAMWTKKQLLKSMQTVIEIAVGNMPQQIIATQKKQTDMQPTITTTDIQPTITTTDIQPTITTNDAANNEPFNLTGLPKDMQNKITALAIMGANAESLQAAAFTIDSLAQVNQELNTLINDPKQCLAIIKSLAKRFDVADMVACKALNTKRAKIQQNLQQELYELCIDTDIPRNKLIKKLAHLISKNADMNFTYHETQSTPLIMAIYGNPALALLLLDTLGIDPKLPNKEGTTPLSAAQAEGNKDLIIRLQQAIVKKP